MKRWSGAAVVGVWLLVASAGGTGGASSGPKEDPWLTDFAAARAASRASGKPILALIH